MIRFQYAGVINRPVHEVFAYVSDFSTLPEYDRFVQSARKTSEGPIGVGTTWTHRRAQGRRSFDAPIRMEAFEPDRRFVMRSGSDGFDVTSTMSFEAAGEGGTRVEEVLEMRLSGFVRLLQPVISRQVPKQGAEVHRKLKEVLESRA